MKLWHKLLALLVIGLLVGLPVVSTAAASPLPQDDRDSGSNGGGGGGGGGGGSDDGGDSDNDGPSDPTCATVLGQVINWGQGGIGDIGVTLQTGSWQVSAKSSSNGTYGFGGLGIGLAQIETTLPPDIENSLQPLINDAWIYLNCNYPTYANVGLVRTPNIQTPVVLGMSAPTQVTAGENTVIRLTISNNLPTPISNIVLTSRLPTEMSPVEISAAENSNITWQFVDGGPDGQLAYIHLTDLSSGAVENILITEAISGNLLSGTTFDQTATLFYRESVAVQKTIQFTVGEGAQPPPPIQTQPTITLTKTVTPTEPTVITAAATITATATPTPTIIPAAQNEEEGFTPPPSLPDTGKASEMFAPPPSLPTTGDESDMFMPPPNFLPETGQSAVTAQRPAALSTTRVSGWVPVIGFGLGGLVFILHQLRTAPPRDHR